MTNCYWADILGMTGYELWICSKSEMEEAFEMRWLKVDEYCGWVMKVGWEEHKTNMVRVFW